MTKYWILVFLAGLIEVGWAMGLKYASNFWMWAGVIALIILSFYVLIIASDKLPVTTVYAGDVPLGAGMSSSAALECCFAYGLNRLFGGGLDRMELALVGQATEHRYVGVNCGIMDQFVSMHGREGSLVRLDCRSGEFEYFPWHPEGYRLVLVNSCVKHELVGSPYNDRRRRCSLAKRLRRAGTGLPASLSKCRRRSRKACRRSM